MHRIEMYIVVHTILFSKWTYVCAEYVYNILELYDTIILTQGYANVPMLCIGQCVTINLNDGI